MDVDELVQHEDRYYIVSGPSRADVHTLVLKHGDAFGVFHSNGDIDRRSPNQGVFLHGMRHLSRLELRLNQRAMLVLSSRVTDDNGFIIVDMTNPDIARDGHVILPRGTVYVWRSIFLWENTLQERIRVTNYAQHDVEATLDVAWRADFADIFEVRGTGRQQRGERAAPLIHGAGITFKYRGLDGQRRHTHVQGSPAPDAIEDSVFHYAMNLPPQGRTEIELSAAFNANEDHTHDLYATNARSMRRAVRRERRDFCCFHSQNTILHRWLQRSIADIHTLTTVSDQGPYPYAGVPWFSAPFGRDGIITALQLLWVNPQVARGVLSYLAATQAQHVDAVSDAEPGKILHERRTNEMANTGEVPFGQYYGSVDATPLFVVLAGAYYQATGDLAFIRTIWPNIEKALHWIDEYGDIDGDGFVEYQSHSERGLVNQGWKDSHDSIFTADGRLAATPIALCEVQGYVYDAKMQAAALAHALGHIAQADELIDQATRLKQQFINEFWDDELGLYALALDGHKQVCLVRSSNAGHALFSGIADEAHAQRIGESLMDESMYSGWGVRTLASGERRFNPMSYHNGSVWPHDNALIAAGFARYGMADAALRVLSGWLNASSFLDLHRLPELICGFRRRRGKGPTLYPVACSPQAWAAGTVFMLLAACLGLSVDGRTRQIHIHRPRLPKFVNDLTIRDLRIGISTDDSDRSSIDLMIHRTRRDIGVLVLRKEGHVDVVVTK